MISLCMIVRDEEENLDRCLKSVAGLVDEIIVVDTGSSDNTKAIARNFGAEVYDFKWGWDFAAARNFSIEKATGDWIICLDADEYLEESSAYRLKELVSRPNPPDVYLLPIKNLMDSELGEWQMSLVLRLFRNSPMLRFQGRIHEQVIVPKGMIPGIAGDGPVIVHLGYAGDRRLVKSRRNIEMLLEEARKDPDNPYLCYYLATEYIARGEFQKAWDNIQTALRGIPREVVLFRLATVRNAVLCLLEMGLGKEAEMLVWEEIEAGGALPELSYYLGTVYQATGEVVRAVECYRQAIDDAGSPKNILGIGTVGRYKCWNRMGVCLKRLHRHLEAVVCFHSSLADNPACVPALTNLVRSHLLCAGGSLTVQYLKRHFEFQSPIMALGAARVMLEHGLYEETEAWIKETWDDPSDPEGWVLLGELHLRQGRVYEALEDLARVPPGTAQYPLALMLSCWCWWKAGSQVPAALMGELAGLRMFHDYVIALLCAIDSSLEGQVMPPVADSSGGQLPLFARRLLERLLACGVFRAAGVLAAWIAENYPGFVWDVVYLYRRLGMDEPAEIIGSLQGMRDDERRKGWANVYRRLAGDHENRVVLLGCTF